MGAQKKSAKGRLDKWYKLAKEKGYRARAAFKLIQLNKKFHVLERSKVLLDLCAAPGSWCQVASEVLPQGAIIVGVDLAPIKPIPRCITFQSDITSDKCRAQIRQHLKTWKADTVLHDGAPNVGTAWIQDAYSQAELVLQSLKLATDFLAPGGTFITKIFRSKDYNSLLWVFNQLFGKVEATKPPSSRNVSAEIFVVCRDYKAPRHIDPRFLDSKAVFAELADPTPNNEAKVFNPEKKKRKREGYDEGDYTQFKSAPASEFIHTTDPIAMLGSLNQLHFNQPHNGDVALAAIVKMPETTQEVRDCCADLKVLGRKDFKLLLRWRLRIRDQFGFSERKKREAREVAERQAEEVAQVEPMDEEMAMQEELQRMKEQADKSKKKERRRDNERKQKEIVRMQMNMTTPFEIGMEAGDLGDDAMFSLKQADRAGATGQIARGNMSLIRPRLEQGKQPETQEESSDEDGDDLEGQLDNMYEQYQEHRSEQDAKYRAKRARKEHNDEFEGFSDREEASEASDDELIEDEDSSDSESDLETVHQAPLSRAVATEQEKQGGSLSGRATRFFDQDLFRSIGAIEGDVHEDSGIDMNDSDESLPKRTAALQRPSASAKPTKVVAPRPAELNIHRKQDHSDDASEASFEIVKSTPLDDNGADSDTWSETAPSKPKESVRPNVDIITAEAMTLAHQLAQGGRAAADEAVDSSYNKYAYRDTEGLPAWFLDDEGQHSKMHKPITAAAAAAIKEKQRALNARPIKKVREAKARKKMRAAQRLERLKKKSALIAEDEEGGLTEGEKFKEMMKTMSKAGNKKPKRKVSVVVAKGGNRGVQGRPKGTKGRYKMVDARLKKDTRGLKRAERKRKK
ncbi:MAG: hypothetical protein Q9159_005473 [Coniocarpon cinnabarinum]